MRKSLIKLYLVHKNILLFVLIKILLKFKKINNYYIIKYFFMSHIDKKYLHITKINQLLSNKIVKKFV